MKPRLLHVSSDTPISPPEQLGPYRIESLIPPADEAALTAYRVRIEAQSTTSVSYHRVAEEIYYVLEGSGVAVLDGVRYPIRAGDFLRLPPGTTHGFVTGDEPLVLLDIHAPGSRPDHDVYFVGETPDGFGGAGLKPRGEEDADFGQG